jgi:hypothetical protein
MVTEFLLFMVWVSYCSWYHITNIASYREQGATTKQLKLRTVGTLLLSSIGGVCCFVAPAVPVTAMALHLYDAYKHR